MSAIVVPSTAKPVVSVLMLTYGACTWVCRSLSALVANTPPVYELVILDNASPDGTGDWLAAEVEGATLLHNPTNVGFGPGVNQAALHARGRYLCLLNSDVLVEPGWLEPMLADLGSVSRCGAVVPRILNLDGTLQEAGAVIGSDAQTMAIGYGDDPTRSWYRFPRYVSYGSGACLCLRRSSFLALGGFDPIYGKGYYEDVDLCLRMAGTGLLTVYEPRSVVRHVRGASSPSSEVSRLLEENAGRFRARWATSIAELPTLAELPTHPYRVLATRDTLAPDRVLVVGAQLPRSSEDGIGRLAAKIMDVAGTARVTVIGLEDTEPAEEAAWLLDQGVELIWGVSDWEDWMRRARNHYSVVVLADATVAEWTMELRERYQPQAALVILGGRGGPAAFPAAVLDRAEAVWGDESGAGLARALAGLGIEPTGPAGWGTKDHSIAAR